MSEKISVLLSDVNIKGNIVEKEKLITDSKIEGDITSENLITHQGSNISGNINSSKVTLGGISKGNIKYKSIILIFFRYTFIRNYWLFNISIIRNN